MRISPLSRALILAGWMGLIFYMSAQPDSGEESSWFLRLLLGPLADRLGPGGFALLHLAFRKAAHFGEYAILALLWAWNLGVTPARLVVSWIAASVYAATDEWHQLFVPGRGPSPLDLAIDSAGALVMLTIVRYRTGR